MESEPTEIILKLCVVRVIVCFESSGALFLLSLARERDIIPSQLGVNLSFSFFFLGIGMFLFYLLLPNVLP